MIYHYYICFLCPIGNLLCFIKKLGHWLEHLNNARLVKSIFMKNHFVNQFLISSNFSFTQKPYNFHKNIVHVVDAWIKLFQMWKCATLNWTVDNFMLMT